MFIFPTIKVNLDIFKMSYKLCFYMFSIKHSNLLNLSKIAWQFFIHHWYTHICFSTKQSMLYNIRSLTLHTKKEKFNWTRKCLSFLTWKLNFPSWKRSGIICFWHLLVKMLHPLYLSKIAWQFVTIINIQISVFHQAASVIKIKSSLP